mgnify:CR=1 FL=1
MNENEQKITSEPEGNEKTENVTATTKAQNNEELVIPVKYNKETINLDITRASELAQKGMKFEALSDELELLKQLASENNQTIRQLLSDLKQQKKDYGKSP